MIPTMQEADMTSAANANAATMIFALGPDNILVISLIGPVETNTLDHQTE